MTTTTHTTSRRLDARGQFEPMPSYGWRCGMHSLQPAEPRHAAHPEYISGLRRGRAQRQGRNIAPTVGLILGLPHLREMRRAIQAVYGDAADADRRLAACYRAAAHGAGQISCMGRDVGAVRLQHADSAADYVAEQWADHRRLSTEYAAEVNRLCRLRGLPAYVSGVAP